MFFREGGGGEICEDFLGDWLNDDDGVLLTYCFSCRYTRFFSYQKDSSDLEILMKFDECVSKFCRLTESVYRDNFEPDVCGRGVDRVDRNDFER